MEININCDLGEKSKHHSNKYDPELLGIVNSANIACGYHAGDEDTMRETIKISKKNCKDTRVTTIEVWLPENSSKGPWYANSNTASSSLLVTNELAIRKFLLSIAPLNGRPT